jgi:hypothetical protein
MYKRKLLRSLQEIQPDFEEEAKAYAGLWIQGKKKKKKQQKPQKKKLLITVCYLSMKRPKWFRNTEQNALT